MPLLVHGEVDRSGGRRVRSRAGVPRATCSARCSSVSRGSRSWSSTSRRARRRSSSRCTGPNVAATITAHHLLINRNALFAGGMRPHHYCLPVLKREEHREALVEAATSRQSEVLPRHRQRAARAAHQGNGLRLRRHLHGARRDRAVRRSVRGRRRARQARRLRQPSSARSSTACRATATRSRWCARTGRCPRRLPFGAERAGAAARGRDAALEALDLANPVFRRRASLARAACGPPAAGATQRARRGVGTANRERPSGALRGARGRRRLLRDPPVRDRPRRDPARTICTICSMRSPGSPSHAPRRASTPCTPRRSRASSGRRGRLRDLLTIFDEGGAIVCAPPSCRAGARLPLEGAVLGAARRDAALHEGARPGPRGARAGAEALARHHLQGDLRRRGADAGNDADACAPAWLAPCRRTHRRATCAPLPIFGYPGWLPRERARRFYEDERYFRPFRRDRRGKITAGVGQAAAVRVTPHGGKSGLRRAGCRVTPWHGDVTNRATETSPAIREACRGVKRGNLHPEQHQIGKRGVGTSPTAGSAELAGRWLEPRGNPGPRGMAAGPSRVRPDRDHRTRLNGRLPLFSHVRGRIILRARGGWPRGRPSMQDRLNQNDVTNRVNVEDPQRVRDVVLGLSPRAFPAGFHAARARVRRLRRPSSRAASQATWPATRCTTTCAIRST